MNVEPLAQRVVELIEGTPLAHLDASSALGAIALVLAGAGLVTLRNFTLGGGGHLPLLVAEPFPHVEALIGVVTSTSDTGDSLAARLRCHAQHPAVDALVVATTDSDTWLLPRWIDGVPIRTAVLRGAAGAGPGVSA